MVKKLQQSKYSQFDVDGDGVVTIRKLLWKKEMMELERQEEKAEAQKKMAWLLWYLCCSLYFYSYLLFR
nr:MAG: hypothetical protein CM15mV30_1840 [uncultured marine virus]